jgi:hypothetical protein
MLAGTAAWQTCAYQSGSIGRSTASGSTASLRSLATTRSFPKRGTYYIRWREGSRLRWRKSSSASNAVLDAKRQEAYLVAFKHGLTPKQEWDKNPPPLQMVYAMPAYLEEYKLSNRIESYNLMRQTLEEFHAHCRKNLISAISRIDLLKYKQWCIEQGADGRQVVAIPIRGLPKADTK